MVSESGYQIYLGSPTLAQDSDSTSVRWGPGVSILKNLPGDPIQQRLITSAQQHPSRGRSKEMAGLNLS